MHHLLWEGYHDPLLLELLLDGLAQIAGDDQSFHHIPGKTAQLEFHPTRTELAEQHKRRRVVQHLEMSSRAFQQHFPDLGRIRTVGHAHRDLDSPHGMAVGHVNDRIGDHVGVGYDDRGTLKVFQFDGAHVDMAHDSFLVADDHPVADLHRPFDQ